MSTPTFTDIEQKYRFTTEHIGFCRDAALDNAPLKHDWQDRQTLARWLYGSIVAFAEEYDCTASQFKAKTPKQSEQLGEWYENLDLDVVRARDAIITKYPLLAEAFA